MKSFTFIFSILFLSGAADANPWDHSYVAKNGTIWSETLSTNNANCIAQRDAHGNPTYQDASHNYVVCEQNKDGTDKVGLSQDGMTVIDSDAVRACKAIGGNLPTYNDYLGIFSETEYLYQVSNDYGLATSTISTSCDDCIVTIFPNNHNKVGYSNADEFDATWPQRCVKYGKN